MMGNLLHRQKGFTLLELMTVVTIVAIIASIGIPSYRQFLVQNAEQETVAEMKLLQNQLEKWRAARLSYQGFTPYRGTDYCGTGINSCYDTGDTENVLVYMPKGTDADTHKYAISILDNQNSGSLVVEDNGQVNTTVGRGWKMVAIPREDGPADEGYSFIVDSFGTQCKTKNPDLALTDENCGDHFTTEQW